MNGLARIAIGISFLAASAMFASAKTTAGSGYWTNGATWVGGVAPVDGDNAVVASGHNVTVDVAVASLASLTNIGTLTFAGWSNTVVTAAGGACPHYVRCPLCSA